MRLRWAEQAVQDLDGIRRYIERDAPHYARLTVERIVHGVARLEAFPESGRVVPELARTDVREVIIGEYRIVYQLESDAVTILTVFRSSRLFPHGLI
jgi:addiction module RelE/StbE family toxin